MKIFNLILVTALIFGCKEDVDTNTLIVQNGSTVSATIHGKNWVVTFQNIEENSLCPEDANCIWLGRVVVTLKINDQISVLGIGDLQTNTEVEIDNSITMDGTVITLLEAFDLEQESTARIKLQFD